MGIRETVWVQGPQISEVNLLLESGQISEREYRAGITYATKILDYLKTIDAPQPYGADLSDFSDEQCLHRKIEMAEARKTLGRAGKKAALVVDRVMVYGEPLGPGDLLLLRDGLRALAGN